MLKRIKNIFKRKEPVIKKKPSRDNAIVKYGSPAKGAYTQFGYKATEFFNANGIVTTSGTADFHMRYERENLVNHARDFYRDNFIYKSLIDRAKDNILGQNGFMLNAITPDKNINEFIEKELWAEFAKDPEIRGNHSWRDIEGIVLSDVLNAGDILINKIRRRGKIQLIESERIKNYNNHSEQGVKLDSIGRNAGYYISDGPYTQKPIYLSARNAIFVVNNTDRISQTRGMPALTSAFSQLHRIKDILDSEAISWQLLARFAVAINKQDWDNDRSDTESDKDNYLTDKIIDIEAGTIFQGSDGEKIEGITQDRPSKNFTESFTTFMRLAALPLGMPIELAMLDWGGTNYSSARASLEQAYLAFSRWQRLLIDKFHSQVYTWKVRQWQRMGLIPDNPIYLKHEWIVPPFPAIDPEADAKAWGINIDRNLTTHTRALKAHNIDPDDQAREAVEDMIRSINSAQAVEKATGEKVDWQHFAGIQVGKTQAAEMVNKGTDKGDTDVKDESN